MAGINANQAVASRPMKNTLVLAFSTLSIYSAYQGIQNIQSSINQKDGLGVASLSCIYAFLILSSILSPLYIYFAGLKKSIIVAFICHCLYTVSNFYPDWWSLIPSSILLGLTVSPMLVAKHVYINAMGQFGSELNKMESHASLSRHNGYFSAFSYLAHVAGNFISSAVLHQSSTDQADLNQTKICGADDCPGNVNKTTEIVRPDATTINTLLWIYLVCGLIGLGTTVIFLSPLTLEGKDKKGLVKNLLMCCTALKDTNVMLFVPICFSQTVTISILYTAFTKAFVSCTVGVKMVGYVMMVYGIASALSAVFFGYIAKYTGRKLLIGFAMVVDCITLLLLFLWKPTPDQAYLLFIIPCIWAAGNGVMASQMSSLVATAFPDKQAAVFSNIETWGSAGYTFVLSTDRLMCLRTKLYIAFLLWAMGTLSYILLEYRLKQQYKRELSVAYYHVDDDDSDDDVVEFDGRLLKSKETQ